MYQHTTYHDERLQPLSVLINYCEHFQEQAEDRRHEAQKKAEAEAERKRSYEQGQPLAKQVFGLMRAAMSQSITRAEYLRRSSEMGFDTEELEAYYSRHGLPLDKPCGHGSVRHHG